MASHKVILLDLISKRAYYMFAPMTSEKAMWIETHTTIASDIEPEQIWIIWSDINSRHLWDLDTEWARLDGAFQVGSVFQFKPRGGPQLSMSITECTPLLSFTDCFKAPLCRLYGMHSMKEIKDGLEITTSIKITGVLGFLLRKIIGEKVAAEVPAQTQELIKLALSRQP